MPTPPLPPSRKTIMVDRRNLVRIWFDEQVMMRGMPAKEADERLNEYETKGKLWIGPGKDMLGSALMMRKLALDMHSWRGARVSFVKGASGDLVIIKGWGAERKLLPGTRYKGTNPKVMELQIGKPGHRAAARESARFGIGLVVIVDVADFALVHRDVGHLLGSLTVDMPSVVLASAVGAWAGSAAAGTLLLGSIACGPLLIGLAAGALAGYLLYRLDEHFHLTEKLTRAYDHGLDKLTEVFRQLGADAERRFAQLEHSRMVHDLSQEAHILAQKLGRQADLLRLGWGF